MENDFQKDKIDDVFSDLETSIDTGDGRAEMSVPNYEAEMVLDEPREEKYENNKKSNLGFFVILAVILTLGVLIIFRIL